MERNTLQQTDDLTTQQRLLLLGDDGRMEDLLGKRLREFHVTHKPHVTDGIVELCQNNYNAVLLNAHPLERKTVSAVKGIRRIAKDILILIYGEPFTETYSKQAMLSGADNYLIWPIPATELRHFLSKPRRTYSHKHSTQETQKILMLEQYKELSQLAGQDKSALIEQTQNLFRETLGVQWLQIREAGFDTDALSNSYTRQPYKVFSLQSPVGIIGDLLLGPPSNPDHPPSELIAQEIALFVGSLIHLAQRCEGLRHLATIDELTGAYNRRYLEFYLQQLIEQSKTEQTEIALLLFDIDDFKHYNDTYGHGAGDDILRQVTQLIHRCCRQQDVVARVGGDEFAVLFWDSGFKREKYTSQDNNGSDSTHSNGQDSHQGTAFFLSNRFRRVLRTSEFPALGPEARGVLTISGGLSTFGKDGQTADELMQQADQALLNAKRSGKNRIYLVGQPKSV